MKLRVKMLAYYGASEDIYHQGKEKFLHIIDQQKVEFVDERPDVLFFLTGGSEGPAIRTLEDEKFYTLIAFQEGNSYASATEVKAYLNQKDICSVLLDYDETGTKEFVGTLYEVNRGMKNLQGQNLGLIGEVSDWLVASNIEPLLLTTKLGIHLKKFSWKNLPTFTRMAVSDELIRTFSTEKTPQLEDTSKVYTLLKTCILDEQLDAITVECFSMVREHAVTACLPLAKFNADSIPAGCEGDLVSIVGMMVAKEVTGIIPWMANTVKVAEEKSLFAHCTIAPNLLTDSAITTHFETGIGTAVQGNFKSDEITLFRFDNMLSKAFVSSGKIVNRPKYETACRTQIEVKLPSSSVRFLRKTPLGNHHLVLPGNHIKTITLACNILGMEIY
jgi:L-fucose isomerase-like protein